VKRFFSVQKMWLPVALSFMFLSCAATVSNTSFLKRMDEVDGLIVSGEAKGAVKILNGLNKGSYSVQQRLGLYKRYYQLGEFASAETCLKKGLSDIPNSMELTAVYAWFLLEKDRIDEAARLSEKLIGTRFGSINAEIELRARGGNKSAGESAYNFAFLPLYVDAYQTTKNNSWLINAAILYALNGSLADAASLAPGGITTNAREAMFWGAVLLDADSPREASAYFDAAERLFSYMDPYETDTTGRALLDLLKADSFIRRGDIERAGKIWLSRSGEDATPGIVFYNLSQKARAEKDYNAWYAFVTECLKRGGESSYALEAYADYALNQPPSAGTGFAGDLKATGLASRGMAVSEAIPRVPLEDAAFRLRNALLQTNSAESYTAYLRFLLAVQALQGSDSFAAAKEASPLKSKNPVVLGKDSWLWDALEENLNPDSGYPDELMRFAFFYLLSRGQFDDAKRTYSFYFAKRNKKPLDEEAAAELMPRLASWECEALAWLFSQSNTALSLRLYEYLYGGELKESSSDSALKAGYEPPFEVVVNLAEMYIARGEKKRALELFQNALSLESEPLRKADLLYRLADFQYANGDAKQALLNIEYCLLLDSGHRAARALQKKIR
jgi:tetratricopeptide (TPR) repeat protein